MTIIPASITTERLIFRLFEDQDSQALLDAAKESHEGLYMWFGGILSRKDLTLHNVQTYIAECQLEFQKREFLQYGVFDRKTEHLIGVGSLHHLDWTVPKGRIGYWVRKNSQGIGYATEAAHVMTLVALDQIKLERVEIRAEIRNRPSALIPKKLGYQFLTVFEKNKRGPNDDLWDLEIHVRLDTAGLPPLEITYA